MDAGACIWGRDGPATGSKDSTRLWILQRVGHFACALLASHPHLKATCRKAAVDRIAEQGIAQPSFAAGLRWRWGICLRIAFQPAATCICSTNVLHDWDEPLVRTLWPKSFEALRPAGCSSSMMRTSTRRRPARCRRGLFSLAHEHLGSKCYSVSEIKAISRKRFQRLSIISDCRRRSVINAEKLNAETNASMTETPRPAGRKLARLCRAYHSARITSANGARGPGGGR